MLKEGIINGQLASVLARFRHVNTLAIFDGPFPSYPNVELVDLVSPVLEAGKHLGYVHIGASHRRPLGSGNIDFDSFLGALAKIGYKGIITFESFSSTVISPDLSNTLGIWRNLWTDNKSMAKSAREYIENKIITAHKNYNFLCLNY